MGPLYRYSSSSRWCSELFLEKFLVTIYGVGPYLDMVPAHRLWPNAVLRAPVWSIALAVKRNSAAIVTVNCLAQMLHPHVRVKRILRIVNVDYGIIPFDVNTPSMVSSKLAWIGERSEGVIVTATFDVIIPQVVAINLLKRTSFFF